MSWLSWHAVGAMHKWTLKRGNIDRSNSERALLTDTCPDDVPIIFSNDGFHANLRRNPKSLGLKRIVESIVRSNSERYTVPYRYRIRLTNTSSRQISLAHPAAQYRACLFYQNYGPVFEGAAQDSYLFGVT
jgi:hypothetical protein